MVYIVLNIKYNKCVKPRDEKWKINHTTKIIIENKQLLRVGYLQKTEQIIKAIL